MLRPATSVSVAVPSLPTISRLRRGAAPPLRGRRSGTTVRARMPLVQQEVTLPSLAHREVARALAADAAAAVPLLPSAVPADVANFWNSAGTAVGTLDVRRGAPTSSVLSLSIPTPRSSCALLYIFLSQAIHLMDKTHHA
jgi:red chlorophyll catabolite reductase